MTEVFCSHPIKQKDEQWVEVSLAERAKKLSSKVLSVLELVTDECLTIKLEVNFLFLSQIAQDTERHHVESKVLERAFVHWVDKWKNQVVIVWCNPQNSVA